VAAGFDRVLALFEAIPLFALASPALLPGPVNRELSSSPMKATRSSTTAEQMALSRAIETRKPAAERICCDPLAERFLGAKYRMLLWGRPFRGAASQRLDTTTLFGRFRVDPVTGAQTGHQIRVVQWRGGRRVLVDRPLRRT
jgi:hypothetical protein